MIQIKLDVTKIDKSKLYKGKKGTYLSCVMIETPESEYGHYMIVQETTKEEREAGTRGAILGNGKILAKRTSEPSEEEKSDLPF